MSMNRQNKTSTPCSNSTPTKNQSSNQTSENQDDNQWPWFLTVEAPDQKIPLNLNAIVLRKAIDGMANADLDNERKYYLLSYGEVFLKNNEPFLRKETSNTSMLSGSCWWYMIVQVCLLISMFPAMPDAQSAAAKWLTRFIWKVIFSCIRWRNIRHK